MQKVLLIQTSLGVVALEHSCQELQKFASQLVSLGLPFEFQGYLAHKLKNLGAVVS